MNISVYITSYNQKEFLKQAIDSVLNQTLLPCEIIIIDDFSKDGSRDLIIQYQESYPDLIKLYFNTQNIGITKTRNLALTLVTGDYTCWLDGDDYYLPRKLEVESQKALKDNLDLVYTNFYYTLGKTGDYHKIWCSDIQELPKGYNIFYNVIARDFPRLTLFRYELVKTSILKNIGGYDENLKIYEDFDFRIRLCKDLKTGYSIEPLSVYRLHEEGLSRAPEEVHLESLSYIYKKYEPEILKLPAKEQERVRNKINAMLHLKNSPIKKEVFLKRVVNKIKSIF